MKTETEFICEFMELKRAEADKFYGKARYYKRAKDRRETGDFVCYFDNDEYFKNWNELMPVVEKIESNDRTLVIIYSDATKIWVDDFEGIELFATTQHGNKDNKIHHVRRACLEYINWHNSQPK